MYGKCDLVPEVIPYICNYYQTPISELFDGTYYLTKIDNKHRRFYARKPVASSSRAFSRLATLGAHVANAEDEEASVFRSVFANFHKEPLRERWNSVNES